MTDYTAHDIHLLDQAYPDAVADIEAYIGNPVHKRRLAEVGPEVFAAELTRDLDASAASPTSLAGWAAIATARLMESGKAWEEDTDAAWAKVDELTAERDAARRLATLNAEQEAANAQIIVDTRAERDALAVEIDQLRMQVYAQKPVIEAAEAWAEMCEDGGIAPDDCRKSEDALFGAVESYRVMDMALTSAREEAEVA